jgi:hypothetical protein
MSKLLSIAGQLPSASLIDSPPGATVRLAAARLPTLQLLSRVDRICLKFAPGQPLPYWQRPPKRRGNLSGFRSC